MNIAPAPRPPCRRFALRAFAVLSLFLPAWLVQAQLAWNVFDETSSIPATLSPDGRVTISIPPGQRATLVATNFVPIDFTAATPATVAVTATFRASGGLSGITAGTRAVGLGLFNSNGTTPGTTFVDDTGYFTWLNGRNTGALIELRRRNGNGPSASLLNPTGSSFNTLGTGSTVQTVGALSDGGTYALTLRLVRSATGISLGTTSANTANAGVVIAGDGVSQTAFTNPDNPPAATVFNEVGFMFFNSTTGTVTLTLDSLTGLTAINPPAIASQPQGLIVNPGQAGTLSVAATGTEPLTYQWRKDGANLSGATGSSYTLASAQNADIGSYTVVVTNAYGTVTSAAATVTVTTQTVPATIVSEPVDVTVTAGQAATFRVSAFGSSPVEYQWQKNGASIAGATTSTLTLNSVTSADAGRYAVIVRNSAATVTSRAATLVVNVPPAIIAQPVGATVTAGERVTFSVSATGTPAPSYQWLKNGTNLPGATAGTLTIENVTLADTGVYTVRITNAVGAVTSAAAVLAIPSAMTVAAFMPASVATGVPVDTPLRVTFDRAPLPGITGRIRLHKAADNTVVDTLDLGAATQTRLIGTNTTPFFFLPIIVTGNTAAIYPHAGVLEYGQTYYVTIEPGAIRDSTGASFIGLADPTVWRFTTKAAAPAAGTTALTVAADGSGDFSTVQGAIDFVPPGNTLRRIITVRKGLYNEINYIGSGKPFVTVRGEDRAQTVIAYSNNANFNTLTGNNRAMFNVDASDFVLETITLRNTTPAGGSQAEALRGSAQRGVLNRVNLSSLQDTLLWNGTLFVTDSFIEGDVDFMWGGGACYFQRCELKALRNGFYTMIRNTATTNGNVYVDCRLTAAEGVTSQYLARIDPNPGNFPYSQVIYLNCAIGPHINPAGWLLNNSASSATVQFWEYRSTDLEGATLDVSRRHPSSRQLTDAEAALWRTPAFVLNGWVPPNFAPTIELGPVTQAAVAGSTVRLSVVATGSPPPSLQWYKDGVPIFGATEATLVVPNVQPAAAGSYSVTATSLGGTVTSAPALVTVARGAFAGAYFGTLGGSATGSFALYVRDDRTGLFVGETGGGTFLARNASVSPGGQVAFMPQGPPGTPVTLVAVIMEGVISSSGAVNGAWGGLTFSGSRAPAGSSEPFAGYYQTGVNGGSMTASLIVGGSGQAFALVQSGASWAAGTGSVNANGAVTVRTAGGLVVAAVIAPNGSSATATVTPATGAATTLSGVADRNAEGLRLREFSMRARVDAANVAVIGFVVRGNAPNDLLIRAIGPTLGEVFGVAGALPNPRLDLYRGSTLIATNTGWGSPAGATAVGLGTVQAGAFPLRFNVADSALRVTLQPGPYTAIMSSAGSGTAGVGLIEVYDISVGAAGQRLANMAARGSAGAGASTLIAGVSVAGTQPKRLLIRGVGPGLMGFGVTGTLARPVLTLYRGGQVIAQNAGWTTSPDAAAIPGAALDAGAFAFGAESADAALVLSLAPGLYTAQISSADGAAGAAMIEIYELPW